MTYRRKALVFLLILCALAGASAVAAPMPCQPGSLGTYLAPAFSCTLGQFTVKSFFFSETQGGLDPTLISVTPSSSATQIGFEFLGNFTSAQGQTFTYVLSYFMDPPPPIIRGQQVDLDPMFSVILQVDLCAGAFPCPGGSDLGTLTATPGNTKAQMPLAPTNMLGVQNTLTLNGVATSGGFDNITFLAPEPAGILLTASGLLGLLAFRSRAKIRQILLQLRS